MHIVLPVHQMYNVFTLLTGSVSKRVGGKKLRGTCDIICKLFEDELAFVLCQGTHRERTGTVGRKKNRRVTRGHRELDARNVISEGRSIGRMHLVLQPLVPRGQTVRRDRGLLCA